MTDRFVIAATVDRLIYGNEETFDPDDAKVLLQALPRKRSPWIQLGIAGKMSGGSTKGFAADDGRGALLCFDADGTPLRMEIRFNRSFRLFWSPVVIMIPGWKPWKTPA